VAIITTEVKTGLFATMKNSEKGRGQDLAR